MPANASNAYLHNGPCSDHYSHLLSISGLVVVRCNFMSGKKHVAGWRGCEIHGCIFSHSRRAICLLSSPSLIYQRPAQHLPGLVASKKGQNDKAMMVKG
jgi:hypothetical protein